MAKSKKMEKMSVLSEFYENPDDVYITPNLSADSLSKIIESTKSVDLPIEQKIKSQSEALNVSPDVSSNVSLNASSQVKHDANVSLKVSSNVSPKKPAKTNVSPEASPNLSSKVSPNVSPEKSPYLQRIVSGLLGEKETKLLYLLIASCSKNLSLTTEEITTKELMRATGLSQGALANAIYKLQKDSVFKASSKQKKHDAIRVFEFSKETFEVIKTKVYVSSNVSFDVSPNVSSNVSKKESNNLNNILTYLNIPEQLLRIGFKEAHLEKLERSADEVQEILNHFAWSIDANEIKSPNKLPVLLSVLKENKQWISEGYLQELRKELEANEKRSMEMKQLKLEQMKHKFEDFKNSNPTFLKEIAEKNPLIRNQDVLENLAFQDFLSSNSN